MSPNTEETAQVSPESTEPKSPSQVVADALSDFAGAPDKDQIEAWKQKHGEVFCSGFAETELYIWRPVNRTEFINLQAHAAQSEKPMTNLEAEEMVVNTCILWASETGRSSLVNKAGSLTALHEQIMSNSNFMDPRVAAALVIKL